MIFRVRITTIEEYTMEAETALDAETRAAARQAEIRSHCHHGEEVTVEVISRIKPKE